MKTNEINEPNKRRNIGFPIDLHTDLKIIAAKNDVEIQELMTLVAKEFLMRIETKPSLLNTIKAKVLLSETANVS